MGRPAIVEFNDVATIANKILLGGGKPTARAILMELGIGSMSTIQTHFKQWQADQAKHILPINHEILSTDITRAINLVIFTKSQEASAELINTLEEEKATSIQIQKEYEQLSLDYEAQSSILKDIETEYAELVGRAEMFESQVNRLITELANERKLSESARIALAILNHRLERVQQLEVEVEMQRVELKSANDRVATMSISNAVAEAKLEVILK